MMVSFTFSGVAEGSATACPNTDNLPALKAAIANVYANTTTDNPGTLIIPSGIYNFKVLADTDTVIINKPITIVFQSGAQFMWGDSSWTTYGPKPLLAIVNTNNVTITNPSFIYSGEFRGSIGGPGSVTKYGYTYPTPNIEFNTNIWVGGSSNVTITGMVSVGKTDQNELFSACVFNPIDGTNKAKNNKLSITTYACSQAANIRGQDTMDISFNVMSYGTASNGVNGPAHAVYFTPEMGSINLNVHDCYDSGVQIAAYTNSLGVSFPQSALYNHTLAVKNVASSTFQNIYSLRRDGLIIMSNVSSTTFDSLLWLNKTDTTYSNVGVISTIHDSTTLNSNLTFSNLSLVSVAPKQITLLDLTNATGSINSNFTLSECMLVRQSDPATWASIHPDAVAVSGKSFNVNFTYTHLGKGVANTYSDGVTDSTGNTITIHQYGDLPTLQIAGLSSGVNTRNSFVNCYPTPVFIS